MYYVVVATLMLAFPVLSVAVEASHFSIGVDSVFIGKWFVFWSVGWRLLLAGVRQIARAVTATLAELARKRLKWQIGNGGGVSTKSWELQTAAYLEAVSDVGDADIAEWVQNAVAHQGANQILGRTISCTNKHCVVAICHASDFIVRLRPQNGRRLRSGTLVRDVPASSFATATIAASSKGSRLDRTCYGARVNATARLRDIGQRG